MATRTWIGGTANNDVTNAVNWSGGVVPVAGDTALATSGTLVMPAGSNLNGVTLDVNEPSGGPAVVVDMTGGNDLTVSNVDGNNAQVVINASGGADTLIVSRGFPAGLSVTVNVMSFYNNGNFLQTFNVAPSGTLASGTGIFATHYNNVAPSGTLALGTGIFATQVGANIQISTEPTSYTGGLPPPGVFPLGPPGNFMVSDQTTGGAWQSQGVPYAGPVLGLTSEIVIPTPDNINVTAEVQNVFIHTGSGEDALDISMVNGNNVLDGSTGSNFLVGGTGNDTFFVDDRGAPAAIWSTVVNFHAGDSATVWGVSPSDFGLSWMDGQGAAGFTGLTLTATAPGKPTAMLTLAGLTSADLTNGKLAVNFGADAASGSNYMLIRGA